MLVCSIFVSGLSAPYYMAVPNTQTSVNPLQYASQLAAAEGRLFDSSVGSVGGGKVNGVRADVVKKAPEVPKKSSKKVSVTTSASSARKGEYGVSSSASNSNSNSNNAIGDNGMRVLRVIPSIIYGQAVVTMAKEGAEAQCYQIFCEMLEAGIVPSTMTTNNVIMELSKKGSHKVATSILDQLARYQVSVSTAALNALFNACDKVHYSHTSVCLSVRLSHKTAEY